MPTYEYRCSSCENHIEVVHSMTTTLLVCPACHKESLVKLISAGLPPIIRGTKTPCRGGRVLEQKPKPEPYTPFWRDDKINPNVLKNPKKYIETGEI